MNRTSCFIKNPSCVSTKPPELSLQLDRDVVTCFEKINDIYSDLLKTRFFTYTTNDNVCKSLIDIQGGSNSWVLHVSFLFSV